MKSFKIKSGLVIALAALCFTACDDDNDSNPAISTNPTEFKLNTPALADQYVEINENSKLDLSWSQPNYGFPVETTYKVQVGEVQPDNTITWQVDTAGNNVFLGAPDTYTATTASVPASQVAEALCSMDGVIEESDYVDKGYRPIAFRVYASVNDASNVETPNSGIFSNPVIFNHLKSYCAVKSLKTIYLVGAPSGWNQPSESNAGVYAAWAIQETAIGSDTYIANFEIPAGQFQFRFYTALDGWDNSSIGAQEADSPVDIELTNNVYSGSLVKGKGSWQISSWTGGYVTCTVNLKNNTIKFEYTGSEAAKIPTGYIYLIGAPSGWNEPSESNASALEAWRLAEYDHNGIYTGIFDIPEGQFQLRFYTELAGWDTGSIGAQEEDSPVDVYMTDNAYNGNAVSGKGSWQIPNWAGGKVKFEYNSNTQKVTFTAQ